MDFVLSAEQCRIRDGVRDYLRRNYPFEHRLEILRGADGWSREHWRAYGECGWLGAALPADVGGLGGSLVEAAIVIEELGRVLALEPYVPCAVLAARTVNAVGSAQQRRRVLPPLARGELIAALAHAEPRGRGDLQLVQTRAVALANGRHLLTGDKALVLGGTGADVLIVPARVAGEARDRAGVSLFVVGADAPGLARRGYRTFDGGQAADLVLTNVEVGADAVVGEEGAGIAAIEDAVDDAIVALCAEAVGIMETAVTLTADFLKTRRAYGTTLSTFQALQHRLADMLVERELSRSMLYRALGALAAADRRARRRTVAAAKALIGRSGRFIGGHALQLHGGRGMADHYIVGHLFKRLSAIDALFGNAAFHLNQYARMPAADPGPAAVVPPRPAPLVSTGV